jgi:RNA polymerase sigma factor (sigma-70 family)
MLKLPQLDELIPTRQSLLSRLKSFDDNESWYEFFQTYWKLIYGTATRSGLTPVESQEVVQETIISVAKNMPGFKYDRSKGSFKGWLLQTTKWRIQDQFRKRQREAAVMIPVKDGSDAGIGIDAIPDPGGIDRVWDDEWQNNLLEAAVQRVKGKVKPKQYQIFDLYVLKKWPVSKVTVTLGVNIGQVYMARHRVTALIKKEVKALEEQF